MINRFIALFNSDGTVYQIIDYIDTPISDGDMIAGKLAKIIETIETASGVISSWHWTGTEFGQHVPKPGTDYYWDTGTFSYLPFSLFTTGNSWNTSTIAANGTSTATFGPSIPSGTVVTINHPPSINPLSPVTITDGTFSFKTSQAGSFDFTFTKDLYTTYTHTVIAT